MWTAKLDYGSSLRGLIRIRSEFSSISTSFLLPLMTMDEGNESCAADRRIRSRTDRTERGSKSPVSTSTGRGTTSEKKFERALSIGSTSAWRERIDRGGD
ncbi:hypothetical protein RHMOL_Rhmol07G0187100 [Rhododendron molle]|uniref:Uncharacterized protein n=1 Tax=Rhododendron molle TaxID=49168 RepID=A0ACC0N439_RHOML|nr:hypothetical protein RHMOL_Rhmol07G0187100 [Rhododendron molle]